MATPDNNPDGTTDAEPSGVRIGHFSDTHLCYERFATLSARGNNQRGEDVVLGFRRAIDGMRSLDVPLAIHSGDLFDRPSAPINYLLEARKGLRKLADIRPDGTRRQVVIFDGNHDHPRKRREASPLELYRGLPGVHVITNDYRQITFDPDTDGCDPALADIVIHAVPHDMLKTLALEERFDDVRPVDGKTNILTTHGVAEGHELFYRAIGREYPIPADLLRKDWAYVALGHFHQQGPVIPGKFGTADPKTDTSNIWYAGSTENISGRDLKGDEIRKRGWLEVEVFGDDTLPEVTPRSFPVRRMLRLPAVDATDADAERIADQLKARIAEEPATTGAIVYQPVTNASRDLWALVDATAARKAAHNCLHYEIVVRYATTGQDDEDGRSHDVVTDLAAGLQEVAEDTIDDEAARTQAVDAARVHLHDALDDGSPDPTDTTPDDDSDDKDSGDTNDEETVTSSETDNDTNNGGNTQEDGDKQAAAA